MRSVETILGLSLLLGTGCGASEASAPEEPPAAAPSPSVTWLEGIARGARDHVDPARGVIFVTYATDASGEDPAADAQGLVRTAERLCGEALEARLDRLGDDLRMRFDDEAWAPMVECEADTCTMPAMGEFDLTGELAFEGGALASVVRVEGGPVTGEFRAAGAEFAAESLQRLSGGTCP